ncbi:ATP-dependent helicase HrpB [Candidatus Tokpelaia sp.]|nr:ATP-dependent helicase C-terminal domain-containing protein [Candidatus Tokpelaia sp.]KAA6405101.1 ATP-dependent helicase HrpB [Candidatus Tokpelaia sp.]
MSETDLPKRQTKATENLPKRQTEAIEDLPIKQVLAGIDAALSGSDNAALSGSDNGTLSDSSSEVLRRRDSRIRRHGDGNEAKPGPVALPRAVLVAPPGAGKSSFVPLHLLQAPWAQQGRIILLEPRRLATRALARRMAQLLGEQVGQTVGYTMRLEKNYSAATRILVMTEGSFTRLILDNPELPGICAVLFDEFHERSLEADFGLALALDVADSLRPDLRILVMSATLDSASIAALLLPGGGAAPVIEARGRNFPVEIIYHPRGQGARGANSRAERVEEAVACACCTWLAGAEGSILAFLPGQAEIKRTQALLEDWLPGIQPGRQRVPAEGPAHSETAAGEAVIIAPLYGGLSAEEQERAIKPVTRPAGRQKRGRATDWGDNIAPAAIIAAAPETRITRKIVLATAIAESALTIEDVRIVIDSGLARLPVFDPVSGMTRLQTQRVSLASAAQRAGRAGRVQAGLAVRLWHEEQNKALPAFTPPEILAADLRNLLLDCADFGIINLRDLRFASPPPAAACRQARQNLQDLGALDKTGQITPLGRALRQLNLPVNHAHMLLSAAQLGRRQAERAAALALVLTEAGLGGAGSDLDNRLENFARDKSARATKARNLAKNLAEKACRLAALLPLPPMSVIKRGDSKNLMSAGEILAATWWERVARRQKDENPRKIGERHRAKPAEYLMANGRGAFIDETSPLFGQPWLVCLELSGSLAKARIRAAAAVSELWLRQHLADKISDETYTVFDEESRALRRFRQCKLGAIMLESVPLPPPQGALADAGWLQAVRQFGLAILPWDKTAENLRARLAFLHGHFGAPWPDVGDQALLGRLEDWLLPHLRGQAQFAAGDSSVLSRALSGLLTYDLRKQAEKLAPSHFTVPTGSNIALCYRQGAAVLSVRVQELFGLRQHPAVAGGKVPLTLELLSPAGRVLQITADIAGFWAGSWQDVAASQRGRYPKHFWPQNPETAAPTGKAKSSKPKSS